IRGFQVNRFICALESKTNLSLNQAIKGRRTAAASSAETAKSSGTTIGLAENRGSQVTDRPAQICMIQNVLEIEARGQIVAFAGLAAAKAATTAAATTTAAGTASAPTTTASTTTTSGCGGAEASATSIGSALSFGVTLAILLTAVLRCGSSLAAKTKGFADAKIRND